MTTDGGRCGGGERCGRGEGEFLLKLARTAELIIAEATVKPHVGRILAMLGVRDRVQALIVDYESGLVEP